MDAISRVHSVRKKNVYGHYIQYYIFQHSINIFIFNRSIVCSLVDRLIYIYLLSVYMIMVLTTVKESPPPFLAKRYDKCVYVCTSSEKAIRV